MTGFSDLRTELTDIKMHFPIDYPAFLVYLPAKEEFDFSAQSSMSS